MKYILSFIYIRFKFIFYYKFNIMKKKNVVSIEDKFLLNQNIFYDKNKKKYILFSYISFLFIFVLLFLNIYIAIKYFNCQKKSNSEEGKNQDAQYKKSHNNNDYINFNNIETKDLNILKLIENEIKNKAQLNFFFFKK